MDVSDYVPNSHRSPAPELSCLPGSPSTPVADSSEFPRMPFSSPADARAPPRPPSPFAQLPSASEGLRLQIPSPSSPPHATRPRHRDPAAAPKLLSEAPRLHLPRKEAPGLPTPPPYRLLPLGYASGLPATLCQLLLLASGSPDASASDPRLCLPSLTPRFQQPRPTTALSQLQRQGHRPDPLRGLRPPGFSPAISSCPKLSC